MPGGEDVPSAGSAPLRTVCHGCRSMREVIVQDGPDLFSSQSMIVPGDGSAYRRIAASLDNGEIIVESTCRLCEDSDEPGWLPGLLLPLSGPRTSATRPTAP